MQKHLPLLRTLALSAALAASLAGCGTLQPANVAGLEHVVGDTLPGAQGLTHEDQDKIDDTIAGLCAAGVFDQTQCEAHTVASAERFQQ